MLMGVAFGISVAIVSAAQHLLRLATVTR